MQIHVMLDIETWGKIPGSDLRSIGAVVFNPITGFVGMPCPSCINGAHEPYGCTDCLNTGKDNRGEFYVNTMNPVEDLQPWTPPQGGSEIKPWRYKYPLKRDPETVDWWSKQSDEAQAAFTHAVDLREALERFRDWLTSLAGNNMLDGEDPLRLWANDPHFDVAILAAAFRAVGLTEPWHYRAPRSQKTITEAAGMTREDYAPFNHGTAHNALDDAISQAGIVCEAFRRLGLQKNGDD